jgi:hypothetical protein
MRVIVLLCVALTLAPGLASGEPTGTPAERAQVYADLGYAAYQKADWNKAIEMYLESYKLSSTADLLFNIAVIYDRKLGNSRWRSSIFASTTRLRTPIPIWSRKPTGGSRI